MNGEEDSHVSMDRKGETFVIVYITVIVGLLAVGCVLVQGMCVIYKIPDMNTTLSNAFMHTCDTIIGALLGWTAKAGAQRLFKKNEPQEVITPPDKPLETIAVAEPSKITEAQPST